MAYSNEDLQKYLKKAQEVLNSKTENHLSEEDLNDIASNLGLNIEEVAQAREDYLTRGNTHLKYDNYAEAIGEFEQLLLLAPNHPDGLYGLAKAYQKKWHNDHKKASKEKALAYANQCIETAPDYKKAYAIISDLKKKPKKPKSSGRPEKAHQPKGNQPKKQGKNNLGWLVYVVPIVTMLGALIGSGIFSRMFSSSPGKNIYQYRVGATSKGIVVWQLEASRHHEKPYYRNTKLTIAEAATGKVLQQIDLPAREGVEGNRLWSVVYETKGEFYDTFHGGFIARDILTGKLTCNFEVLASRFKELAEGIGKARRDKNWLKLTTKQGADFWYNLKKGKLVKQKQYNNQHRTKVWQHQWTKLANPDNRNQSKVLLTQYLGRKRNQHAYTKSLRNTSSRSLNAQLRRGYLKLVTPIKKANYFLKPEMIYGDSLLALFRYKTEVGKAGAYRIACVDKAGNVLWENSWSDFEDPLLRLLITRRLFRGIFTRYENTLAISSNHVRIEGSHAAKFAVGLDLTTGEVLWKHSPRYYKTKFKKEEKKAK